MLSGKTPRAANPNLFDRSGGIDRRLDEPHIRCGAVRFRNPRSSAARRITSARVDVARTHPRQDRHVGANLRLYL